MKDEPIFYVGSDVHQSTTVASRARRAGRRADAGDGVPAEEKAIVRLVGSAGRGVHVAFEEGTQA